MSHNSRKIANKYNIFSVTFVAMPIVDNCKECLSVECGHSGYWHVSWIISYQVFAYHPPPPPSSIHSAGTSGVVNHSCAQYNINKQMDIILGHTAQSPISSMREESMLRVTLGYRKNNTCWALRMVNGAIHIRHTDFMRYLARVPRTLRAADIKSMKYKAGVRGRRGRTIAGTWVTSGPGPSVFMEQWSSAQNIRAQTSN